MIPDEILKHIETQNQIAQQQLQLLKDIKEGQETDRKEFLEIKNAEDVAREKIFKALVGKDIAEEWKTPPAMRESLPCGNRYAQLGDILGEFEDLRTFLCSGLLVVVSVVGLVTVFLHWALQ